MPSSRSVLTIGSFDGVHRGHAALVRRAREIASTASLQSTARVVVLAFDPHPLTILNPDAAPARITSFDLRRRLLLAAGADEVIQLLPDPTLLAQSPEAFIASIVEQHHPLAIVEGPDFRFGKARAGDLNLLASLGARLNFDLDILAPVQVTLQDHSVVQVSSTLCRWLLRQGRVRDAAILLGRPHLLQGTVVPGDRRGRTIGFPTANIQTDLLLPADAVYAARARLPDGRTLPAALNVGQRPTFAGAARTVEAHLLLSNHDPASPPWSPIPGLPEYAWPIELELLGWLRDQARFAAIPALVAQLHRDCQRVREIEAAPGAAFTPDLSPPLPSAAPALPTSSPQPAGTLA